jgi:hypothetical protein
MKKKRRVYGPRLVGGQVMMPADLLGLSKQRELQTRWQRLAGLILEEADIGAVSRQLDLALFMDAKLDVAKMPCPSRKSYPHIAIRKQ